MAPSRQFESDVSFLRLSRIQFDRIFHRVEPVPVRKSLWDLVSTMCGAQGSMVAERTYVDRDILPCFNDWRISRLRSGQR